MWMRSGGASVSLALLCLGCGGPAPSEDAGAREDAAQARDAAMTDAGADHDAGGPAVDAATTDAGPMLDAGAPTTRLDEIVGRLTDPGASAASLDDVIYEVAWTDGWPLRDGSRVVFVTRWEDAAGPVSMVSDVNGWDTAAHPATALAGGHHYLVVAARSSFVSALEGAHYKWYAATVYRAPPEATAYGSDGFGPYGYVAPPTDVAWRERFLGFRSAFLTPARGFRALLPAGFDRDRGDARVLFMHDGQNLFDEGAPAGGWRVDETLSTPAYDDIVVLAVDNASDRFDAYTHTHDDIGTGSTIGGAADAYLRLVHEEALPFFRARYGLADDPGRLAMGGSSLGGLVTLHQAEHTPDQVSCVIAMSSTLGWGAFARTADADALVLRWMTHGAAAIYLDSGGAGTCADTDGFAARQNWTTLARQEWTTG